MTICGSCSREVPADFAFCPYCGAALASAAPPREQRKRVTILFCDITGSTALGESTDPEALRAILARYFERMKGIIERHGGTVEKFIGDAVMAVFGVPQVHEDDALRAVRAAAEMRAALPELGVMARIGINSGEVVTGTAERLATGDAVNVAARLEQAAPPGEVLLGEDTLRLIRDSVEVEAGVPLTLKGKSEPVPAYRLVSVGESADRRHLAVPMIGRERELDRLRLSYSQAVHDRSCQLFTVLGAAGVGKSRLTLEFLGGLEGARVVRSRCLSYGEGITYWPVAEIKQQLDALPSDAYAASALRPLLGETPVSASTEEIAWAFRTLLEEQAQNGPLVVVFDDIHWAEETLLDLIEHSADLSSDAPILLLCMARPELLEKRPGWGGGKWNATTVLLEPLDAAETDQLVDALGGVDESLRERIRQAAEGNPLFVEEMLALIRDAGEQDVSVPPTIHALLAARLDQLAPDERRVLECAAVEGRVFHRSAIQVLAEDEDLRSNLLGLVRKQLVRPERAQLRSGEAYRFRHLLIRDAAYDSLPKAVRADLHQRFAGWLEERAEDLVEVDEIVGYHLEQAARYGQELGRPDAALARRAGERLARAGQHALWRSDVRTARGLLERALTLLRPLSWNTYLEMDLLVSTPHRTVGGTVQALEEIARRAAEAGDTAGAAVARVRAADQRLFTASGGPPDRIEAEARALIPLLEAEGDHDGLVRIWDTLASLALAREQHEEWARRIEQTIFHARKIGRPGLFGLGPALGLGPRPADEALAVLEPLLVEHPDPYALNWHALLLGMRGRFDEAWAEAEATTERWRELTGIRSSGAVQMGWLAQLAGDHERAIRHFRLACEVWEEQGHFAYLSTFLPEIGRSLCALGRFEEAEPLADRGRELGAEDDIATQSLWRQVKARVLAHRGEYEEAERLAREAVAIYGETDALNYQGDAWCQLAEVLLEAGQVKEATEAFEQALDRYQRKRNLTLADRTRRRMSAVQQSLPAT
jgi:class 3 adenylate cyclase/tetratricopeptide (TPR) repeat protein